MLRASCGPSKGTYLLYFLGAKKGVPGFGMALFSMIKGRKTLRLCGQLLNYDLDKTQVTALLFAFSSHKLGN